LLPFTRARVGVCVCVCVCVCVYLPSFRCLMLCILSNENVQTIYRGY
jgi:hypothetical protein